MTLPTIIFIFPLLLLPPFYLHAEAKGFIQVGYWNYRNELPASEINSTLFTHLICAFADVDNLTYKLSIPSSSFFSFSNVTKSKNPSLTTLLSIGGGYANDTILSTMISQSSHRRAFIDSSLQTARLYGFDGLDFSWPAAINSSQMTNMATLFTEWRGAIDTENRNSKTTQLILTIATNFQPSIDTVPLPVNSIRNNADWVHLLNYAYHTPSTGKSTNGQADLYDPSSQRNTNFGLNEWITRGLPAEKLVLGLPFFGYAWKLADPDKQYIGAPSKGPAYSEDGGALGYNQIRAHIDQDNASTEYNSTYVQNYCFFGNTWIGYDDTEAVKAKVSYIKDQKLLGYHIWEISQDDNWTLSKAAAQSLGLSADGTTTADGTATADGTTTKRPKKKILPIILPIIASIVLLTGAISCYYLKRRRGKGRDEIRRVTRSRTKGGFHSLKTNADGLRAFSLGAIKASTDNFSTYNKLGQGGYGPVYKGQLEDGKTIAVKQLSESSEQGLEEFENEVTLLARLQHVNLVRILGFCTEGREKMLVYEYMPNGSLDSYLFDPARRFLLDWRKRVQIIEGVIQGLLYLQEYSRLTIIHRDIKPSNVLLDSTMTPKIADFGMARIFEKNDPEANTGKIVGTYGYVPPEYATRGAYSVKLDVYSFGILLLQVISGRTTFSTYGVSEIQAVSQHAYEMWEEGKAKEFMDPTLDDSDTSFSMTRYLQVALLCVQENPEERPTMLEVLYMINSDIKDLPIPCTPAFSVRRGSGRNTESSQVANTVNEETISEMIPR